MELRLRGSACKSIKPDTVVHEPDHNSKNSENQSCLVLIHKIKVRIEEPGIAKIKFNISQHRIQTEKK